MEDLGTVCPFVQILGLPVPQTVGNVTEALRILDRPLAEQLIEVPKISCSPCPSRSLIPEPQSAEQLVEVPTVLSPLRIAEQIVGIPVPPNGSSIATHSSLERIPERIVERFFRTFPLNKKKCGVRSRPESERARQCQLMDLGGL